MIGFAALSVVAGVGFVLQGLATWSQGLAADQALGAGAGGILLAFVLLGGKIR
jgi:hypothetical protein